MRTSRQNSALAKTIFRAVCENNEVSETKLEKFLKILRVHKNKDSLEILTSLEKQIKSLLDQGRLVVNSPFPIGVEEQKTIQTLFEKKLSRKLIVETKIDKELIGGTKISNADTVWENTIISQLSSLKGKI